MYLIFPSPFSSIFYICTLNTVKSLEIKREKNIFTSNNFKFLLQCGLYYIIDNVVHIMLKKKRIIHDKDIICTICGVFNELLMQFFRNNETYAEASEKLSFAAFSILLYSTILFPKHRLTS